MPKQYLTGTLEEQCDFLYQLAQEKMTAGNFTGAAHALKEVVRHRPDYQDAAQLLTFVRQKKSEQRNLLLVSLLGAVLFVGIGTFSGISNDIILLLLAVTGLLVGYGSTNLIRSLRRSSSKKRG